MFKKILSFLICFICFSSLCIKGYGNNTPSISSGSAILLENSTSKILFEKDSHKRLEPASITKILTAILIIENTNPENIVTVNQNAISIIPEGYSIANLQANEQLSVDSLLKLLLVHSANDAANVLAFYLDGSIEVFANRMNSKIKELGLKDSNFTNPSGMHDDNHYSSSYDIAKIMQYCVKNPIFRKYAGLKLCNIPSTNLTPERTFNNTNSMFLENSPYYYPNVISAKTGFTSQAKNCLVSLGSKNGIECICVILSADSSEMRFLDTKTLLDFAFLNYSFRNVISKGTPISNVSISNGTNDTKNLNLILDDDINIFIDNNFDINSISPQITLKNIPLAPISKNTILGYATYIIDDKNYEVNLIASHDVEVSTSKTYYLQIFLLIIVIILLIVVFFWNTEKKNKKNDD